MALTVAMTTVMAMPASAARNAGSASRMEAPHGAGGVVHKAIRGLAKALRSPGLPRVLNFLLKKDATPEQIGLVTRYAGATAKILDDLSKWDELSLAVVRGQVQAMLVAGGATKADAALVAFWVHKMLDWGL